MVLTAHHVRSLLRRLPASLAAFALLALVAWNQYYLPMHLLSEEHFGFASLAHPQSEVPGEQDQDEDHNHRPHSAADHLINLEPVRVPDAITALPPAAELPPPQVPSAIPDFFAPKPLSLRHGPRGPPTFPLLPCEHVRC